MATLDGNIQASVVTDAPPVGTAGFGIMIVVDEMTFADDSLVKRYANAAESAADTDLTDHQKAAIASAFAQRPRPAQVAAGSKAVADTYAQALDKIVAEDSAFYGVIIASRTKADIEGVATWALSNERKFMAQTSDADCKTAVTTDVMSVVKATSNGRCGILFYGDNTIPADAAWMAQTLAVDPDQGTTTWRYKTLAGIPVDKMSTTEKGHIESKNGNVYLKFYGQGATDSGTLSDGSKMDVLVTVDWCLARVRESYAQALLSASNRGSKIPFDDTGFATFTQKTRDVLLLGEAVGHFIEGSHYVNMPRRSDVTESDAQNRILRFEFGAALAGAVETLSVNGTLSVDLSLIDQLAGRE